MGDGPEPIEAEWVYFIGRYGAQAVMGRALSVIEMRRLAMYERVMRAFRARAEAPNWAVWAGENPAENAMLERAMNDPLPSPPPIGGGR